MATSAGPLYPSRPMATRAGPLYPSRPLAARTGALYPSRPMATSIGALYPSRPMATSIGALYPSRPAQATIVCLEEGSRCGLERISGGSTAQSSGLKVTRRAGQEARHVEAGLDELSLRLPRGRDREARAKKQRTRTCAAPVSGVVRVSVTCSQMRGYEDEYYTFESPRP